MGAGTGRGGYGDGGGGRRVSIQLETQQSAQLLYSHILTHYEVSMVISHGNLLGFGRP